MVLIIWLLINLLVYMSVVFFVFVLFVYVGGFDIWRFLYYVRDFDIDLEISSEGVRFVWCLLLL